MKITVVTPSYQQLPYLRRCARSVEDQHGAFTLEHLIQDGAGGTELEEWVAAQSFAKVIIEPDRGMYDAINRGFKRADGDILAWLNCDEQYLPDTLQKVCKWFEAHPEHDILFGDVILVEPDGTPLAYRKAVQPLRGHIRSCFLPTFSAATFVRRRVIDQGHLLDTNYRAISDAVWIDELLGAGFRSGITNEALATFTMTGDNLGQSSISSEEGERWKMACRSQGFIKSQFWSILHRFRKFFAGAYRRREVDIAIYLEGRSERLPRKAIVGSAWKPRLRSMS